MSFDYNPYKHYEIIHDPPGTFRWYCHSCGGTREDDGWSLHQLALLISNFEQHILYSHGYSKKDLEGWSIY